MQRAALYVRVSSQGQVRDGYSLAFQEEILQEFCQRESLTVAGLYRDGGESGSTTNRKGLSRLIEDARRNLFDVVLIFRVDRFSRDPVDLLALVRELEGRGIRLRSVTEAVDAGDPAGELMLTILGAIGKFVRQNIIQNAMLGKAKRAETGRYTGGSIPFGYVVDEGGSYQPDQRHWWNGRSAAAVVALLFDLYIKTASQGGGCSRVAQSLSALGVPPPRAAWNHAGVYQMLKNPCYAGDFAYNRRSHPLHKRSRQVEPEDWVLVQNAHPPLVERSTWERVQELLAKNRTGGRAPGAATDVVAGFLRCGQCGAALTPRRPSRSQRYLYYTCASRYSERRRREGGACSRFPWLRGDRLGRLIWEGLVRAATSQERVEQIRRWAAASRGPDVAEAEGALARLGRRLTGLESQAMALTTAYAQGTLPEYLWQRQLARVEQERGATAAGRHEAEQRLAELRSQSADVLPPEQMQAYLRRRLLDGLTLAERRDALALLVGSRGIRVMPDGTVEVKVQASLGPVTEEDGPGWVN